VWQGEQAAFIDNSVMQAKVAAFVYEHIKHSTLHPSLICVHVLTDRHADCCNQPSFMADPFGGSSHALAGC